MDVRLSGQVEIRGIIMKQPIHVGLTALEGERTKLLQEYDSAVAQAADDPVKTEHGISCEAHFRSLMGASGRFPKPKVGGSSPPGRV